MARAPLLLLLAVSSLVLSAYCTSLPAVDIDDPAKDEVLGGDEMTGFPLDDLNDDALKELMEVEDDIFLDQTGVHIAKKLFLEAEDHGTRSKRAVRRKCFLGPLIMGGLAAFGRAIFSKFSKGAVTRSGPRVTQQYHAPGSYQGAVSDFNKLKPSNVKPFDNGRGISGQTGIMDNKRVTVRNGSSGDSRPTLEIRSHGGDMVRKFRYENHRSKHHEPK